MTIWNPIIVEELRQMRAAGHTALRAAAMLNRKYGLDVTRNAVMGKWHRMGLSAPTAHRVGPKPPKPRSTPFQFGKPTSTTAIEPVPFKEIEQPAIAPPHEQKSIMDLDDRFKLCRYPHGLKAYSYCARPTVPGTSYCIDHVKVCYVVPPDKARVANTEVFPDTRKNHQREDA